MIKQLSIDLIEIVKGISECVDLVNSVFSKHHIRVACVALNIAEEMNIPLEEKRDLLIASLLHDTGALSIKERLRYLEFEADFEVKNPYRHAEIGYRLFRDFEPFLNPALFIKYHHTYYKDIENNKLPIGAYILQLADRIAISVRRDDDILSQSQDIKERVYGQKNGMFSPDVVDAFLDVSRRDSFWFDIVYMPLDALIEESNLDKGIDMNLEKLYSLAFIFHILIDFRSRFTASHSCGVAGVAVELARYLGFSKEEIKLIEISGYLHDLGKIAIPIEILEKPDKLTQEEFNLMKSHVYYTYRILEHIKGLETINIWASFHHEKLDGSGYPFGLKGENLSLGSRIMAVSDIFTALTEDRPYRRGLSLYDALEYIKTLVRDKKLDRDVFSVLERNIDFIAEKLFDIKKKGIERFNNLYSDMEV